MIRNPKKSFIIGSQPIAEFQDWFPVHCKVAVRLTSPRGSDELIVFDDIGEIRQINEDIVRRSTIFAGPSQYLIESLAHPWFCQVAKGKASVTGTMTPIVDR